MVGCPAWHAPVPFGHPMRLPILSEDKFHDECGVFGVFGHPEASNLAYLGIHALQHRGQESAGIASWDGATVHLHKAMGLVADIFGQQALAGLPGSTAIGHTRYSTAGQSNLANAQPMVARTTAGQVAVAHNGNLVNAEELRAELAAKGALFQGTWAERLVQGAASKQYVKNWNTIFAGVVVLSAPVTVLYLLMQRRLIAGLTAGAIK